MPARVQYAYTCDACGATATVEIQEGAFLQLQGYRPPGPIPPPGWTILGPDLVCCDQHTVETVTLIGGQRSDHVLAARVATVAAATVAPTTAATAPAATPTVTP